MVKIRLKRIGMRQQPSYRIVAIESQRSRDGAYLESLGFYDPRRKLLTLNLERAEHWLSTGAQPTNTTLKLIRRYRREHPDSEVETAAGATKPDSRETAASTETGEAQ